jgi:hypothetical protein
VRSAAAFSRRHHSTAEPSRGHPFDQVQRLQWWHVHADLGEALRDLLKHERA